MPIINKVRGHVTLLPVGQSMLGLRAEITLGATTGPVPLPAGTWIASTLIDSEGEFNILTVDVDLLGVPLIVSIYKGTQLIVNQTAVPDANRDISIVADTSKYDLAVKDDSRVDETINYALIQGRITLGAGGITAVPSPGNTVHIVANKMLFRDPQALVVTTVDDFGRYELKVPYRLLFPEIIGSPPVMQRAIASICIEVLLNNGSVAFSNPIALTDNHIQVDLSIEDPGYFYGFYTEFDYLTDRIRQLTNLLPAFFFTISTDGPMSEQETIITSSGLDADGVRNRIGAANVVEQLGIDPTHAYALVKAKSSNIKDITNLSAGDIAEIIGRGQTDYVIPMAGNVGTTINLLAAQQTNLLTEDTTEDEVGVLPFLNIFTNNDPVQSQQFLQLTMEFKDLPVEAFWAEVAHQTTIDVAKAQKTLQISALTGMQPEMTEALSSGLDEGDIIMLVTITISSWVLFITEVNTAQGKLCIPYSITGGQTSNPEVLVQKYAEHLYAVSNDLFATAAIAIKIDQIAEGKMQDPVAVRDFLLNNTGFDLRLQNVWEEVGILPGLTETIKEDLLPVQNLTRITQGKPDAVIQMINAGIRSSSDIRAIQQQDFVAAYSEVLGGDVQALQIYQRAVYTDSLSMQGYLQTLPGNYLEQVTLNWNPAVWKSGNPPAPHSPDLETLFGSMDFCTCTDCTSMYSPSAYFTDILNFIKTRMGNSLAYNELNRRRPDLVHIDLSCKNANTPLPYIDLVNEQLELLVLRSIETSPPSIPLSFQTSGTAAELEAFPEHVYKNSNGDYEDYPGFARVYDTALKNAVYPNNLPFDLALEESRVYFKHLGPSRFALMEAYKPMDYTTLTDPGAISEYLLLTEYLGLSQVAADIIAKIAHPGVPTDTKAFYGPGLGSTWYQELCNDLNDLLQRSNITYRELLQVLNTDFLNPEIGEEQYRPFVITAQPGYPADTCMVDNLMLDYQHPIGTSLPAVAEKTAFFDKLHRFIRLYRATGWTIYQLDIVLMSLREPDIDKDVYMAVAQAYKWSKDFQLEPEKICVLWSNISTRRYINFDSDRQSLIPSLYDRFFRNRSVSNPPNPNFEDPDNIIGDYSANGGAIMAAFNITEDDIWSVVTNLAEPVTLARLSMLYYTGIISAQFGYASFRELTNVAVAWETPFPLPSNNPFGMLNDWKVRFPFWNKQKRSIFSTKELNYIILNIDSGNNMIPGADNIQSFYESLRLELRNLLNTDSTTNDELLTRVVNQQFSATFGLENAWVTFLLQEVILLPGSLEPLTKGLISKEFINSTNDITSQNSVPGLAFNNLYDAYFRLTKIALITSRLKLSADEAILFQRHHAELNVLNLRQLPYSTIVSPILPIYGLLLMEDWVKARDLLRIAAFDFTTLLLASIGLNSDGTPSTKIYWLLLVSKFTGWTRAELEVLVGGPFASSVGLLRVVFFPASPSANDFNKGSLLLQLMGIMESSVRTGIRPGSTQAALLPGITVAQSRDIRKAAKAKYTNEAWLKIAKPLQDALRDQQRKALVAYIMGHPDMVPGNNMTWRNENELFAYLLIDVEMQPCMMTSRIRQAMSTLQLYVDRIILNIEYTNATTLITMSPAMVAQWETWRKWYRIWEANRKVFLYPENWIEPELRDNKTPFFKDLETFLLQDEITAGRVEDGYAQYLEQLDEVARLEPVSAFHEEGPGRDIVHVFSRTDMYPQRYFYRRLEDKEWSPWERINVNIKSDHVVPVMWNGKLYLFWLTFQGRKLTDEEITARKWDNRMSNQVEWIDQLTGRPGLLSEPGGEHAYTQWDITLNWSQYKDGKWLANDLSRDVMGLDISKVQINNEAKNSYSDASLSRSVLKILTKRGEIKIDELFKNRLYLFTPYEAKDDSEGVTFNLMFPAGLDENGIGLHAFLWKGDNSRAPYVLRDNDRGHQIIAPLGTRFNKMKFEAGPIPEGQVRRLRKDSYTGIIDGYYSYSAGYYISNFPRDVRSTASLTVLNNIPYDRFRITARAANEGTHSINPLEERYFFEDEGHTFYVEQHKSTVWMEAKQLSGIFKASKVSLANTINFVVSAYGIQTQQMTAVVNGPTLYTSALSNVFGTETHRFHTFYHEQFPRFMSSFNKGGVPALLTLANQAQGDTLDFAGKYQPTSLVSTLYPHNRVQFDYSEPYSIYNWELFFHAPMLIAQGLSNNQQFDQARKWYHYIFDPTSNTNASGATVSTNQRFWKFYPFYKESGQAAQTLNELLMAIHNNVSAATQQVGKWENNPFNPHIIARSRILAYMKNVLMKYLDNLIAWGDQLFRRDTIESINEATQLYILAGNILGDRPKEIPPRVLKDVYTFSELLDANGGPLDALSNAMVAIESFFAPNAAPAGNGQPVPGGGPGSEQMPLVSLYFCLSPNDKLLQYWDTIADRLFKIRNCRNMEGVERQLPLYEPPIDPALLVRAMAMGVNINTILNDISMVNAPLYRFTFTLQKANELVADVKALGNALLSALEKKDAEALSRLRSGQELQLMERVLLLKEKQVEEAEAVLEATQRNQENTQLRYNYYSSRPFKNANEQKHLDKVQNAMVLQGVQGGLEVVAGVLSVMPTFHLQAIASGLSEGGLQLANVMRAASAAVGIKVALDNGQGNMAFTTGGYERRRDDWNFQASSASKELEQMAQQVLAAEIRLDIARRELRNQEVQIEQATALDAYMRNKFTNTELYTWMSAQISATYFQHYQLAYDMARRAEFCYQYELPLALYPSSGFVKFGYWDTLRKGLVSGERLQFDLRKMEATYLEANRREFELTKNVSMAMFAPEELLELRRSGVCTLEIPEVLFDLDYPGHFLRRIKSVSISIPCIAGPYTTINGTLRLKRSKYRKDIIGGDYPETPDAWNGNVPEPNRDNRFVYMDHAQGAIATSTAQYDSGVFELNFRDERYLPFEGSGAISQWELSFPDEFRQFNYASINDVIFHIRYTASDGGLELKTDAAQHLKTVFSLENEVLARYFSLRHEFSQEWAAYNIDFDENPYRRLRVPLMNDSFPFFSQGRKITIDRFTVGLAAAYQLEDDFILQITYTSETGFQTLEIALNAGNNYTGEALLEENNLLVINRNIKLLQIGLFYEEGLQVTNMVEELNDLYLVASYRLSTMDNDWPDNDEPQLDIPYGAMATWWNAESYDELSNDGRVLNLRDLSGNGVAMTPISGGQGPELSISNGVMALKFQNNLLQNSTKLDIISGLDSFTIFYVGDSCWGRGVDQSPNYEWSIQMTQDVLGVVMSENGWTTYNISKNTGEQNLFIASVEQIQNGFEFTIFNGTGEYTNNMFYNNRYLRDATVIGMMLGASKGLTDYVNGMMYECLIYRRAMGSAERQSVLAYLRSKYPFAF